VKGRGGGSTCTSAAEEEDSRGGGSAAEAAHQATSDGHSRQIRQGRHGGGGMDVGRRWVEVATSMMAAVAATDGEGGSSLAKMADSSRRVRVLLGLLTGPSSPLSLQY
jgi:hypothetical protein